MADSKCHLLNLPAELRVLIWEIVLAQTRCFRRQGYLKLAPVPSLLQANRQIRHETRPIHYNHTIFHVHISFQPNHYDKWLRDMGENAVKRIRRVRLSHSYHSSFDILIKLDGGTADKKLNYMMARLGPEPVNTYVKQRAEREAVRTMALLAKELRKMMKRSGNGLRIEDWRSLIEMFIQEARRRE
ncbi:hypothetical protein LTR27_001210 [Elasticomyces elasticus]|nr:hypothetical protein LTR27_001210 [Elasticomyces elasticus]